MANAPAAAPSHTQPRPVGTSAASSRTALAPQRMALAETMGSSDVSSPADKSPASTLADLCSIASLAEMSSIEETPKCDIPTVCRRICQLTAKGAVALSELQALYANAYGRPIEIRQLRAGSLREMIQKHMLTHLMLIDVPSGVTLVTRRPTDAASVESDGSSMHIQAQSGNRQQPLGAMRTLYQPQPVPAPPRERKCSSCNSQTHKTAASHECPEHKCARCHGVHPPKGHNKNNCPLKPPPGCIEPAGSRLITAGASMLNAVSRPPQLQTLLPPQEQQPPPTPPQVLCAPTAQQSDESDQSASPPAEQEPNPAFALFSLLAPLNRPLASATANAQPSGATGSDASDDDGAGVAHDDFDDGQGMGVAEKPEMGVAEKPEMGVAEKPEIADE